MADINKIASDWHYKQTETVKFLLAENLALKMLLFDKGILDPKVFEDYKAQATETLKMKTDKFVEDWKKANPDAVRMIQEAESNLRATPTEALPVVS